MKATALIDVLVSFDPVLNTYQREYEWKGPKNGIAALASHDLMCSRDDISGLCEMDWPAPGVTFQMGALNLLCIHVNDWPPTYYCSLYGWNGRLKIWQWRFKHWLLLIHHRLILTLWVWRLANRKPGQIISLRDVHFVQKLDKAFRGKN